MSYLYDLWGWYAGTAEQGAPRSTPVAPVNENTQATEGLPRANWSGYAWADRPYVAPVPIPEPGPVVPAKVTRRQARMALVLGGHSLAGIDAVINAMDEPTRTMAQIFWQDSNEFERNNAMLNQVGAILGLTDEQIDALFIAAEGL